MDGHWSEEGGEEEGEVSCTERERGGFHPSIIELGTCHCFWRRKGSRRSCGKNLSSPRIVEGVKTVVFAKCQKVFDNGLGKQMNSNCHDI